MKLLIVLLCLAVYAKATCPAGGVYESGVSDTVKKEIVDKHNALRLLAANGKISGQPKASNMKRMSWDTALAKAAQDITNTCVYGHVTVTDPRFSVGQNLYGWQSTALISGSNFTSGIQDWFDEVKTWAWSNTNFNHYTQVIWANSYLVGCGYIHFKNQDNWNEKYYVCNYGPAGNVANQYPYKTGTGCENLC